MVVTEMDVSRPGTLGNWTSSPGLQPYVHYLDNTSRSIHHSREKNQQGVRLWRQDDREECLRTVQKPVVPKIDTDRL